MKIEISTEEFKSKLPELVEQLKRGKRFTISNRGEVVADLIPAQRKPRAGVVAEAEKLKKFMRAAPVRGIKSKEYYATIL